MWSKWGKPLSRACLWVWEKKQVLVINSPFVWNQELLNEQREKTFSVPLPLNGRKVTRAYNKGSHCILPFLWCLPEGGHSLEAWTPVTNRAAVRVG